MKFAETNFTDQLFLKECNYQRNKIEIVKGKGQGRGFVSKRGLSANGETLDCSFFFIGLIEYN